MMGIIKDMYKAYSDLIEKGLRNRLQAFSFRNIDRIFLDPIELDNNGNIFSGFENRFLIWFSIILRLITLGNNLFLL